MITIFWSRGFYVIKVITSVEIKKNKSLACSVHDGANETNSRVNVRSNLNGVCEGKTNVTIYIQPLFKWKPSNSTACAVQRGSDVQVCIKPEFNHLKM